MLSAGAMTNIEHIGGQPYDTWLEYALAPVILYATQDLTESLKLGFEDISARKDGLRRRLSCQCHMRTKV
jgi:hypothetical protein